MKKLFYPLFGFAALAMTGTSCQDELDNGGATNGNEAVVSFNVQLENETGSRAVGDGLTATELHYAVYKVDKDASDGIGIGDEIEALRGTGTTVIKDHKAEVKFTLVKGQTYNFLFWAQCKDGYKYYTIDYEKGTVKVLYTDADASEDKEDWQIAANDENRDAFFKVHKDVLVNGPVNETITLKRPFAQVNVGTGIGSLADAATAEVWIKQSSFKIDNVATKLDAYTGQVSEPVSVTYTSAAVIEDLTDLNDGEGDLKNVDDKNYEYLAMNYILVDDNNGENNADVDGSKKAIVNAWLNIYGSQTADGALDATPINTFEIPNIPVQRNWRTNIIGDILNETVTFNIVIDPNFDNDHNYFTEKELAYAFASGGEVTLDKDVTVDAPFYLKDAKDADKVIKENTIVVNLNGKTLTYTGKDIMARLGEGATVTFNGPGKVVASHYIASANAGGTVIVNGGDYSGNTTTLFQANGGEVYIKGGTFVNTDATNGATYLLNHIDGEKDNGLIEVTGGTFTGFDPAASKSENPVMNFVKYGYKSQPVDGTENKYEVVENPLEQMSMKGGTFQLDADMEIVRPLVVAKDMVLDLNGKTISNNKDNQETDAIIVKPGATLTINGEGTIEAVTGNDGYAVISEGVLIINGGTFKSGEDADGEANAVIYARGNGKVYVNGGNFPNESNSGYVLNKKDADRATTVIEVTGGTFKGFDPANNTAEGAATSFVVDGYASTPVDTDNDQTNDSYIVTVKKAGDGETVTLGSDGIITNSIAVAGGTLDGNGYTLAQSETPVTNLLVSATGAATIKNLNIVGGQAWNDNGTMRGPRALYFTGLDGDIVIENVETSGVCYALNVNASSAKSTSDLIVRNSTLRGWTSYGSGLTSALFSNVKFEKGSYHEGETLKEYAYCRPYVKTRFDGCAFEKEFKVDENINGSGTYPVIEFKNCTYDGKKITKKEDLKDLFEDDADLKNVTVIQ